MMKKNAEEFQTVNELADEQKLIDCYQIQIKDDKCISVFLGKYPDVPLPVHKIIKYNKYMLHIVTYILTKDEVDMGLLKIVGVNVFRQNCKNSMCSLDLVMNKEENKYQLIFSDHKKNTFEVIEKLEKIPDNDKIIEYIIHKAFEDPIKSLIADQ